MSFNYISESFEDRILSVSEMLTSMPGLTNTEISDRLNSSVEFVKRQRKFLGISEPNSKPEPERIVEEITDPDEYFKPTPGKRFRRSKVQEHIGEILKMNKAGFRKNVIAAKFNVHVHTIRKIIVKYGGE